ncbi:TolC family protein [Tenacibaculum piscium]|uniref:Transporter n=1 Tax=Tenacibaculum piscium TaxID=1458515 RepID=A0A2H1YIE5_9FLAO|nr:TolC family protein [Tenacibaculum piscium]MBE7629790.1 TolC family protein [Tenacibaculum piscium]MBE7670202.1 TolC family protein [Tenacibaculum piscium]SOS75200.1 Transporter [Tenacibaculum piscium]
MKNKLLIVFFLLFSLLINAQQVLVITKNEVLTKVKENNRTIKMSKQDVLVAKADYNQTNAVFLPNITASHTAMATTNPLMAFGFKLNQEILTQNDFNPDLLNNPSQINNFATKIAVEQPLINLDGIYQRKAAKAKLNATTFQQERTKDYMQLEVEKAYMQLQLAYKMLSVLEKVQQTANENKRLATNNFQQGYLQRADVLAVEVRVTEIANQLQYAKSNIENASNYISLLMNDTSNRILKPSDLLTVTPEIITTTKLSENRADIKAMRFAKEGFKNIHKANKMSFLPRLNAFGSYELYDDEIFKADANGYLVGVQLSWDVFKGSKRFGKTQKSKAELDKSEIAFEQYLAKSNMELNSAKRMLIDAKNNLNLTQLALSQSAELLRIKKNRFEQGLEKTTDLLSAETKYAQKQLEYYQTVFQHNYAKAYVQFLTKE